jgi:hypothetical protein
VENLREQAERKYVVAYLFAILYTGLGEKDQAFGWLDKAYDVRSCWSPWRRVEPKFDRLRSDPQFGTRCGASGLRLDLVASPRILESYYYIL